MIMSGFEVIIFKAEVNADMFLEEKGVTIIKKNPLYFYTTKEEASEKIKEWENKNYHVRKSLFKMKDEEKDKYYCFKQYTQEEKDKYNKEKLRFIYYYIGKHLTWQNAERYVRDQCEKSNVTFESLGLRVPHCFGGDACCSLFCPYYNKKCTCTVEEFEKQELQKQYYEYEDKKGI